MGVVLGCLVMGACEQMARYYRERGEAHRSYLEDAARLRRFEFEPETVVDNGDGTVSDHHPVPDTSWTFAGESRWRSCYVRTIGMRTQKHCLPWQTGPVVCP